MEPRTTSSRRRIGCASSHSRELFAPHATRLHLTRTLYSFLGIFSWQFLPAVIFPTLTSIAVLCLMNNKSLIMRTLGSGYDGFGLLDLSLDWSVVGGTGALCEFGDGFRGEVSTS